MSDRRKKEIEGLFPEIKSGVLHSRTLNKSSSAPTTTVQNPTSWLSKLGNLFKSISSIDPTSQEKAVNASSQQRTTALQPSGREMRPNDLPSRQQQTKLGEQSQDKKVGIAAAEGRSLQKQTSTLLRFSNSFKGLISGMFKRGTAGNDRKENPKALPALPEQEERHISPVTSSAPKGPVLVVQPQPVSRNDKKMLDTTAPINNQPASPKRRVVQPKVDLPNNLVALASDLPPGMGREIWKVEDYTDIDELHMGYASEVYSAVCKYSGLPVVLKIYHPERLHEISQYQLFREARLHSQLSHPNIIKLYAAFKQEDGVVMVLEYADQQDLLKLLLKAVRMSERKSVQLVVEPLLQALNYLHSKSIIHRDIKLENIMFHGPDMTLKLGDFGLCLNLQEERSVTRAGTLDYMAPEVLKCPTKNFPQENKERKDLSYNCAVDIWALGVTAYELINGIPPFSRLDRNETERLILRHWQPPFLVFATEICKQYVYSSLDPNAKTRPSALQLLHHPWIKAHSAKKSSVSASSEISGSHSLQHAPSLSKQSLAAGTSRAIDMAAAGERHEGDKGRSEIEAVYQDTQDAAPLPNSVPESDVWKENTNAQDVSQHQRLPLETASSLQVAQPQKKHSTDIGRNFKKEGTTSLPVISRNAAELGSQELEGSTFSGMEERISAVDPSHRLLLDELQHAETQKECMGAPSLEAVKERVQDNSIKQMWEEAVQKVNQEAQERRIERLLKRQEGINKRHAFQHN